MIKIREEDERIAVAFPYNPDYIVKVKSIEGYRWHPEGRYWSVPYSWLEKLLSIFDGESIVIDPGIYLDELKRELILKIQSESDKAVFVS